MTYGELLRIGVEKIGRNRSKDAEDLLCYSAKITFAELLANKNTEINGIIEPIYCKLIDEYLLGRPLAYITHDACFYGYNFFINEGCLIPRIDSEVLIETVLKRVNDSCTTLNIVDACCGSGCLGITLVKELSKKHVISNLTLIDKSTSAMQVAKLNCEKYNVGAKYIIADVLSYGFGNEKYDIIVCNPPYIETNEIDKLDKQVKDYEPKIALDGGDDGLKFYRFLSGKVKQSLSSNGLAVFEIGYNQGKTARDIFERQKLSVELIKDYGRNDRALLIR